MNIIKYIEESILSIKKHTNKKPKIGLILGSGWGHFVDNLKIEKKIPYSEIPHFSQTHVIGHSGNLVFGEFAGHDLVVLQGRVHFYEGHSMSQVVHLVRTLGSMGVEKLVITNAAGGLDTKNMTPGDFMVIEDHINLMGTNPLIGPNLDSIGTRFPDMTEAYDRELSKQLLTAFEKENVRHSKGIYLAVTGPTYETPAEIRAFKTLGATAVGMSTVPEVIAARHMGLRVCGISCITNLGAGLSLNKLSHDEVSLVAKTAEKDISRVLKRFFETLQ